MTIFICGHCHYKFERPKMPNRCPYCGRDGVLEAQKTAEQLLKETVGED
ncbi:MAG: hypothetical protein V1735_03560 [Nanoarchaeota archaeon]